MSDGSKMAFDWKTMGRQAFQDVATTLVSATRKEAEFKQSLQWILEQPERWLSPTVVACATDFVNSEMDWKTEGARGYGRITESIPRLAGWQREGFSRLKPAEGDALRVGVTEMLLRGYAINTLMEGVVRQQIYQPQNVAQGQFWEKWIPLLYGSPAAADAISPLKPTISIVAQGQMERLKATLSRAGIRIGFLAGSRLMAIVNGYLESGVLLRLVEVWGKFSDEVQETESAERTRPQGLARFLNGWWGVHKTPKGLAAKLEEDLLLETVNPDELWAYFAIVVAHTALGNDFSQEDINEFFNIAAMERGGSTRYDALFGLVQRRLPEYIETFSNLALMIEGGVKGGVIAAMRKVAENIAGESDMGLRMTLASETADIAQKTKEFIQTLA